MLINIIEQQELVLQNQKEKHVYNEQHKQTKLKKKKLKEVTYQRET